MPEEALEALGLAGLYAKITGKSRSRSRSSSFDRTSRARSRSRVGRRDRSRSGPEHKKEVLQQALKAAVLAGAGAAFLARNEEGGWKGEKGKRVLTAALTAGGVDGFINRDKDPEKNQFVDTVGAAVAGLATNRLVNGPASRSRSRVPRGRRLSSSDRGSRSRSRSRVGDLLAGGGLAAAAKKAVDSVRGRSKSRERGRERSRSSSYDSRDYSRSPPRRGVRDRSRSVVARGLAKLGMDKQADKLDGGSRERSRSRGPRSRSRGRYADDDYRERPYDSSTYGRGSMYDNREVSNDPSSRSRALDPDNGALINRPQSVGPAGDRLRAPPPDYRYDNRPRKNGDPETDSDSDLGSSSEDEETNKKSRKRLAISSGLATVATIHAGHSVYESVEKRQVRKRALKNGTIDAEEAAKHKNKDRLQDAASIGLAALGLKSAYSEWKELKEQNDELKEDTEKRKRHARKREARRQKAKLAKKAGHGMPEQGAPTFTEPTYGEHDGQSWYDGGPPYMSGANGEMPQQGQGPMMNGMNHTAQYPQYAQHSQYAQHPQYTQYYDDNPYAWMGHQANPEQQGYNGAGGGQHYGNPNGGAPMGYGYPPAQGGTGFPPPPGGQPLPPQTRT